MVRAPVTILVDGAAMASPGSKYARAASTSIASSVYPQAQLNEMPAKNAPFPLSIIKPV
jgi:hypothetical protein